jgi:hypothetical protein
MLRYLLYIVFFMHLIIIILYNLGKQICDRPILGLDMYIEPFFTQEWEMFAPPPQFNTNLYYQFQIFRNDKSETSIQYEILGTLYKKQLMQEKSFARLSYYLFNCCQDITENQLEGVLDLAKKKIINEKNINELLVKKIYKLYSHKSLIKHARKTFDAQFSGLKIDSVYVSYSITHDKINKSNLIQPNWRLSSKFVKI